MKITHKIAAIATILALSQIVASVQGHAYGSNIYLECARQAAIATANHSQVQSTHNTTLGIRTSTSPWHGQSMFVGQGDDSNEHKREKTEFECVMDDILARIERFKDNRDNYLFYLRSYLDQLTLKTYIKERIVLAMQAHLELEEEAKKAPPITPQNLYRVQLQDPMKPFYIDPKKPVEQVHQPLQEPVVPPLEDIVSVRTYPSRCDETPLLRTSAEMDNELLITDDEELEPENQEPSSTSTHPEARVSAEATQGESWKGYVRSVQTDLPTFHNPTYLRQLAQNYSHELEKIKTSHPDYTQYHVRLEDRNRGLLGNLDISGNVEQCNESFENYVYAQFPEAHAFDDFSGNAAQRILHNELRENIQLAADAARTSPNNAYIQAQIPTVFAFTDLARQQENPAAAFNFSDAGFHILNAAKKFGTELMKLPLPPVFFTGMLFKGGAKAIERSLDHWADFRDAPVKTLVHDIGALFILGYEALKAGYTIALGASEDRQKLCEAAQTLAFYIKDNPDEWAALAIQMRFCPTPLSAVRATQSGAARLLRRAMRREAAWSKSFKRVAQHIEREYLLVHEVATPEGVVLHYSGDIVRGRGSDALTAAKEIEDGAKLIVPLIAEGTQKSGKITAFKLLTQPTATITENALVSAVRAIEKTERGVLESPSIFSLAAEKYTPENLPTEGLSKHYFHPTLDKGKFVGLHSTLYHSNLLVAETVLPPDTNGVSVGIFCYEGRYKVSEIGPDSWTEDDFNSMVREAFKNIDSTKIKNFGAEGRTNSGIPFALWFKKDKQTKEIVPSSAYPLYQGDEAAKAALFAKARELNQLSGKD